MTWFVTADEPVRRRPRFLLSPPPPAFGRRSPVVSVFLAPAALTAVPPLTERMFAVVDVEPGRDSDDLLSCVRRPGVRFDFTL